jgi:hypothetical protein
MVASSMDAGTTAVTHRVKMMTSELSSQQMGRRRCKGSQYGTPQQRSRIVNTLGGNSRSPRFLAPPAAQALQAQRHHTFTRYKNFKAAQCTTTVGRRRRVRGGGGKVTKRVVRKHNNCFHNLYYPPPSHRAFQLVIGTSSDIFLRAPAVENFGKQLKHNLN